MVGDDDAPLGLEDLLAGAVYPILPHLVLETRQGNLHQIPVVGRGEGAHKVNRDLLAFQQFDIILGVVPLVKDKDKPLCSLHDLIVAVKQVTYGRRKKGDIIGVSAADMLKDGDAESSENGELQAHLALVVSVLFIFTELCQAVGGARLMEGIEIGGIVEHHIQEKVEAIGKVFPDAPLDGLNIGVVKDLLQLIDISLAIGLKGPQGLLFLNLFFLDQLIEGVPERFTMEAQVAELLQPGKIGHLVPATHLLLGGVIAHAVDGRVKNKIPHTDLLDLSGGNTIDEVSKPDALSPEFGKLKIKMT